MYPKQYKITIIILAFLSLALAGGLIYSIVSSNSKAASLNYVIFYEGESRKKDLAAMTATQTALESSIQEAQNNYDDLNAKYQKAVAQLSAANDETSKLRAQLMCPSTIPHVDYTNDGTVGTALREFTSDYKITDDYYAAVLEGAKITYHRLKSDRTESFFMVFYTDENNGRVNGVFDILGQCWVNLNNQ